MNPGEQLNPHGRRLTNDLWFSGLSQVAERDVLPRVNRMYSANKNYASFSGHNAFSRVGTIAPGNQASATYTYDTATNHLDSRQHAEFLSFLKHFHPEHGEICRLFRHLLQLSITRSAPIKS